MSNWKQIAAPIIREALLKSTGRIRGPFTEEEKRLVRKELRELYPFGERRYWPYKVWLHEIRCALEGQKDYSYDEMETKGQKRLFD